MEKIDKWQKELKAPRHLPGYSEGTLSSKKNAVGNISKQLRSCKVEEEEKTMKREQTAAQKHKLTCKRAAAPETY